MRQGLCKEDNLTKANEKLKETNTSHKKGGGEGEPVPSRPGEKKKAGWGVVSGSQSLCLRNE